MTKDAGFKRRVRTRMAKTGEAYSAARETLERGEGERPPRVLHVTNGDSVAGTLRESGLPGRVLPWRDVLHDGPVPAADPRELRRIRSEHLAARGWGDPPQIENEMATRDALLDEYLRDSYVLWFEADLYDQLQLVQVLESLRRLEVEPGQITLVSVGEYRGIAHFGGLGELSGGQLALLAGEGQTLSAQDLELGRQAWEAFTASDPAGLTAVTKARSPEFRYLGEAFARLCQEYPSRADGLSLTQRRILMAVEGEASAWEVFRRVWQAERRPFLGDSVCWALLGDLAGCAYPLLDLAREPVPFARRRVRLTATGKKVLAGREDHVRRNGIDRWIGGVHLAGHSTPWRYDERLETLLPA